MNMEMGLGYAPFNNISVLSVIWTCFLLISMSEIVCWCWKLSASVTSNTLWSYRQKQYTVRFECQMDIFTTNLPVILVIMSVLTFKNAIILYIWWQSVLLSEETREERKAQIWFKWLSNVFTYLLLYQIHCHWAEIELNSLCARHWLHRYCYIRHDIHST